MGNTGNRQSTLTPNIVQTSMVNSLNNARFSATDDSDFHQLYNGKQYYIDQNFDIDTQMAIMDYLNPDHMGGSLYSISQSINYKMETGQALNTAEQAIVDDMLRGMHNIGYNTTLTRYGRVDYMDRFAQLLNNNNINSRNFGNMTEAQLKKILVGTEFTENKLVSTSYNNFSKAPNGGAPFTDKAIKFNYKAPANAQALMPGDASIRDPRTGRYVRNQLGEMILAPGQNYRITDVRFTGRTGRSGASSYRQVEFDIEIF